jgi:hypothetical protein
LSGYFVRGTPQQCPRHGPDAGATGLLFGRINLLFPTRQFRCYFKKFRCSEKQRFGCKPLRLLAGRARIFQKFAVNSAVISNYQGISKLWRKREGADRRALGRLEAVVHPINNQPVDPDG